MRLSEQIQEGQALAIKMLKIVREELEKLEHEQTAIATFKSTFEAELPKLITDVYSRKRTIRLMRENSTYGKFKGSTKS